LRLGLWRARWVRLPESQRLEIRRLMPWGLTPGAPIRRTTPETVPEALGLDTLCAELRNTTSFLVSRVPDAILHPGPFFSKMNARTIIRTN